MSTATHTPRADSRVGLIALFLALLAPLSALAVCPVANGTVQQKSTAIANGHAFNAHVGTGEFNNGQVIAGLAFPFATVATIPQFSALIQGVMTGTGPSRPLHNNRVAYWSPASGTVVIYNPAANDCGTAFRPVAGIAYYNNLQ